MTSFLTSNIQVFFKLLFSNLLTINVFSLWVCNSNKPCSTLNPSFLYPYNSENNLCLYYDPSNSLSWIDASQFCINLSGTLVTLETDQKYQLVKNMTYSKQSVWVSTKIFLKFYFLHILKLS